MAEVQLFGDYLNLHGHSIAARGEKRTEQGRDRYDMRGRVRERPKRRGRENQKDKRKRVEEKSPSQVGLEMTGRREEPRFTYAK